LTRLLDIRHSRLPQVGTRTPRQLAQREAMWLRIDDAGQEVPMTALFIVRAEINDESDREPFDRSNFRTFRPPRSCWIRTP
jgi:hypothetical protein